MEQKGTRMSLRVAQEEQVEHRVGLEEVDEGPAEDPATQGQETEPGNDQQHVLHEGRRARLGRLACTIRPKQILKRVNNVEMLKLKSEISTADQHQVNRLTETFKEYCKRE